MIRWRIGALQRLAARRSLPASSGRLVEVRGLRGNRPGDAARREASSVDRTRRLKASTQAGLQRVAVPPAQGEARACAEQDHVLAVERRPQLLNAIDVHDGAPVDADELLR